jgi:hypothetical protein
MNTSTANLSNNDWLAKITSKLDLSPITAFLILAAFNALLSVSLAVIFNAWDELASEPLSWFYIVIVQPAALSYFVWMQHAGTVIFSSLKKGKVVETKGGLEKEFEISQRRYGSSTARIIAWLCAIIVIIWFNLAANNILLSFGDPSWLTVHPGIILISSPIIFIVYYALVLVVYDIAVIVAALMAIFKNNQIRVEPLHPDGAGGFGAIGRFVANLGFGIAMLGFALAASAIQAQTNSYLDYALVTNIVLYAIFAPTLFLIPIWSGHRAMVGYRDRLGLEVSDEFENEFSLLRANQKQNVESMEPALRRVQQLVEMRAIISDFPIWPYNATSLRKYVGLVLSPLVPVAISIIVDLIPIPTQ